MSLKYKFIVLFLFSSCIPFLCVGVLIYSDVRAVRQNIITNQLETLTKIQKNRVEQLIRQYEERIQLAAADSFLKAALDEYLFGVEKDSLSLISAHLQDAKTSIRNIKNISVASLQGDIIASTDREQLGKNIITASYFNKGLTSVDSTTLIKDDQNRVLLFLAAPLKYENKQLGVLVAQSYTDELFSLFRDTSPLGETGDWGMSMREDNGDALLVVPRRVDKNPNSALESRISSSETNLPVIHGINGEESVFFNTIDYRGVPVFSATAFIPSHQWAIGTTIDRSEVFAPIEKVVIQMRFLVVLIILFVTFISYFFSQLILRPLTLLVMAVNKIRQGDFNVTFPPPSTDEIGSLSRDFKEMSLQLKNIYEGLEHKVKERTQELIKFQKVVESSTDGVLITDIKGNIEYVNSAWQKMTKYSANEVIGKNVRLLKSEKTPPKVFKELWEHLSQGLAFSTEEIVNVRKDRSQYNAQLQIFPVLDKGAVLFYVELSQDITVRKAKEKSRNDFISVASHQLLTPIAVIQGYLSLITSGKHGRISAEIKKYLLEAQSGTQRMSRLVKQLLTTSRIDTGRLIHMQKDFDVTTLLHKVHDSLSMKAKQKKLLFTCDVPQKLTLHADEDHVFEAVANLVDNAITYTQQGKIMLKADQDDSSITIMVSDTGCGIEPEYQAHIFEKYYWMERWNDRKPGSHGLGLYIAQSLITGMGGTLTVESVVGKGSTFTIKFPKLKEENHEKNIIG